MATVNVILHGLFVIEKSANGLMVLAPEMGREHVYRAGNWLGEAELRRGRYTLQGVKPGSADFDPTRNIRVKDIQLVADAENQAYASIRFPHPRQIKSLRCIPLNRDTDLTGADARSVEVTSAAMVQILIYDADDLREVGFPEHQWEASDLKDGTVNLHIFAEEDVLPTSGHAMRGFDAAVALIDNFDLKLVEDKDVPAFNAAVEELPAGVAAMELADYVDQQNRLAAVGRELRKILLSNGGQDDSFSGLRDAFGVAEPTAGRAGGCTIFIVERSNGL